MPGADVIEAVAPVLNHDPPCARCCCRQHCRDSGNGCAAVPSAAAAIDGGGQRSCAEEQDGGADYRLDNVHRRAQPGALGEKAEEVGKGGPRGIAQRGQELRCSGGLGGGGRLRWASEVPWKE